MSAASSSETAKPLQRFVTSHPWLFILALVVILEVILWPISLLIKIILLSLRVPVQPIKYPINDLIELSLVIVAFVFLSQLNWWRQTGFTKGIRGKDVPVCLFPTLFTLLIIASGALSLLISGPGKISPGQLVLIAILSCLIGVAEESFFRGLMVQTLLPKGVLRAIFLSALLFALLHVANLFAGLSMGYVLGQVLNAFGDGIAYAVMRVRTGSIWPAITLHSLTDFGALVIISRYGVGHPTSSTALLGGGIICSLYLIYAAIALRPSKLRELRTRYQTVPHVPTFFVA